MKPLTFQELLLDATSLAGLRWDAPILLRCSVCGEICEKKRSKVLAAVRAHQHGMYCSAICSARGQHNWRSSNTIIREQEGRVCSVCGVWKNLSSFPKKGRKCRSCRGQTLGCKCSEYKASAKKRGLSFEITLEDFATVLQNPCYYCGDVALHKGIDRRDNTLGYTNLNVVPCCSACNMMKGTFSEDEFLNRCRCIAGKPMGGGSEAPSEGHSDGDSAEGRVCKECGIQKPLRLMAKGWKCRACWGQTPRVKFHVYRKSARVRRHSFVLSFEEFFAFWGKPCIYCRGSIKTIGLDRVDSAKGYTQENVVPCCSSCNRMKRGMGQDVFMQKCREIARKHPYHPGRTGRHGDEADQPELRYHLWRVTDATR